MPEIGKAVSRLWQIAPDVLMVRNSVKSEDVSVKQFEASRALDIPSKITEELQGSHLLPLWTDLLGRIK
jgi:hypothetical protein